MKRITFMVLALGLLALTQRVWADVYRGTIGNANVVLELTLGDALGTGRFFDVQDHKNRVLTAWIEGMDDESLIVVPDSQLDSSISDDALNKRHHMVLRPNKEKQSWQGEWRQPNGQRLPVNLVRLSNVDVTVDNTQTVKQGLLDISLYDYLLWQNQPMEFLGERDMWGYRLAWWQDVQTEAKVFQFVSGYPPETMAALNRTLQQEWWKILLKQQACVGNGGMTQQIQITLISSSLVSYINQIYNKCHVSPHSEGDDDDDDYWVKSDDDPEQSDDDKSIEEAISGAHGFWVKPQTLSTRTAKPVALSQLLSIGEKNAAGEYRLLYADFDRSLPKWLASHKLGIDGGPQSQRNWFATTKGLRFYDDLYVYITGGGGLSAISAIAKQTPMLVPWSFVKNHPSVEVQNGELVLP
ncbi:hypothetical protein [Dickeya oryzae]|uniref:Uncharacterized protein n=1 Tax=Dickeya oryzae TaxID=1240404 RepID=A0AB39IBR0_9GAMM|nr:hypothetical protein [Dickeya oryzae]MCA6995799.1 hypothetical protein [Dickeya oryzae]